jgi:hypothetical protein
MCNPGTVLNASGAVRRWSRSMSAAVITVIEFATWVIGVGIVVGDVTVIAGRVCGVVCVAACGRIEDRAGRAAFARLVGLRDRAGRAAFARLVGLRFCAAVGGGGGWTMTGARVPVEGAFCA